MACGPLLPRRPRDLSKLMATEPRTQGDESPSINKSTSKSVLFQCIAPLVAEPHLWVRAEAVSAVEETLANVARPVAVAVLDPGRGAARVAVGQGPREPHLVAVVLGVKVLWPHRLPEQDVVIEILGRDENNTQHT